MSQDTGQSTADCPVPGESERHAGREVGELGESERHAGRDVGVPGESERHPSRDVDEARPATVPADCCAPDESERHASRDVEGCPAFP